MTKSKRFGFSGIYDDLINELTFGWLWKITVPALFLVSEVNAGLEKGLHHRTRRLVVDRRDHDKPPAV